MKRLLLLLPLVLLAACDGRPPETLPSRLLRENFTFVQWRAALRREPSPADLGELLDALAAAQQQAPGRALALAEDAELRQRALRTPEVRAKAMKIFGMTAPEGLPSVQQILHTAPGDNCPVCRDRARMQNPSNGL